MAVKPTINRKISAYNFTKYNGRDIDGIVMHYVGAISTAKNNADYFAGGNRNASAHFFVDENEIWQSVEIENSAWHCGGGPHSQGSGGSSWGYKLGNYNTIGIEMCCKTIDGKTCVPYAVMENAARLVQWLIEAYGVDPAAVCRHYDITGKTCPAYIELDGHAVSGLDDDNWYRAWCLLVGKTQASTPAPTPETPQNPVTASKLDVDGYWGTNTTKALQTALGTFVDGIVSNQYNVYKAKNPGLTTGWQWVAKPGSGSKVIRALQKKIGANIDGIAGPETFKALQKHFGTPVDGEIWGPSAVVKAMQKALNEGTF